MANKTPAWPAYTHALRQLIQNPNPPKVIAFIGQEGYLIQRGREALQKYWRKQKRELTLTEAAGLQPKAFAPYWQETSLFANNPLYILQRAEKATKLASLLATVPSAAQIQNHICICHNAKPNAALKKQLERLEAMIIPCDNLHAREYHQVITALARKHQLELTPQAVDMLIETQGMELYALENEITKLSLAFENNKKLDHNDILEYLKLTKKDHVFELENLLLAQDYANAQSMMTGLLARGEAPPLVIGIIAGHCRKALGVKELKQAGVQKYDIAKQLKLPVFVVERYLNQGQKLAKSGLIATLLQCQEVDMLVKSSKVASDVLIAGLLDTHAGSSFSH